MKDTDTCICFIIHGTNVQNDFAESQMQKLPGAQGDKKGRCEFPAQVMHQNMGIIDP